VNGSIGGERRQSRIFRFVEDYDPGEKQRLARRQSLFVGDGLE
jgi:hypothetical protein